MIPNCVSCSGSRPGQYFVSGPGWDYGQGRISYYLGHQEWRIDLLCIVNEQNMIDFFLCTLTVLDYYEKIETMTRSMRLLCASDDVWQGPGLHKQVASLAAARWWFAQFVHRQCFSNLQESTEPAQSLHNLFKSSQKGCHGDRWIKMDIQWPV